MRSEKPVMARLLAVAVVAVGAATTACRRADPHEPGAVARPNLVLITIDTLRADHVGAYGYARDTSPEMDRLAGEGILFEQAQVQWPKTNPSMASMMSSTYCMTNGVREYGAPIDPKLMTLAQIMDRAGYYCASFVANAHLGRFFNFDRGFDEVHELWAERQHAHPLSLNYVGTYDNERIAALVTAWIGAHQDETFFLWLHLLDPHGPYEPPEALQTPYLDDEIYDSQNMGVAWAQVPYYQRREGMALLADYVARYDGEVAYSDQVVSRVVAELDAHGLAGNTLLVVSADHGESLGEHKYYFDHGKYMYQSCLRVPLVFYWPGTIPAGRRIDTPVGMIDLLPTLLELLGIDISPYRAEFQGHSFAASIRGAPMAGRAIFAEGAAGQVSIRRGKWKLIDDPRADPKTGQVGLQLYDLSQDPAETNNLAERLPQVRDQMHAQLRAWKERMQETIGRYKTQRVDAKLLSPEMRQLFRARGWLREGEGEPDSGDEGLKELTPEKRKELEEITNWLRSMGYIQESEADAETDER